MPSPKQRLGAEAEAAAEAFLVRRGYNVVGRNWRGGGGEIDRICWHADVLCFVEIRYRRSANFGGAAASVGPRKQRILTRAAEAYLQRFPPARAPPCRFDVVGLALFGRRLRATLVPNAFPGDGPRTWLPSVPGCSRGR